MNPVAAVAALASITLPEAGSDVRAEGDRFWVQTATGGWWVSADGALTPTSADAPFDGGTCSARAAVTHDGHVISAGRCQIPDGQTPALWVDDRLVDPHTGAVWGLLPLDAEATVACRTDDCFVSDAIGLRRVWANGEERLLAMRVDDLATGGASVAWRVGDVTTLDGTVLQGIEPGDLVSSTTALWVVNATTATRIQSGQRQTGPHTGGAHAATPSHLARLEGSTLHIGAPLSAGLVPPIAKNRTSESRVEATNAWRLATPWDRDRWGRAEPLRTFAIGGGIEAGGVLGPQRGVLGSPWLFGTVELSAGRTRFWVGADTAPTVVQFGDVFLWHLAVGQAGLTFGSPHLRAGPFVGAGLLQAQAGLRAFALPWTLRSGYHHGIEGRISWATGPETGELTTVVGLVDVAWTVQIPTKTPGPSAKNAVLPSCHRLGGTLGVSGGVTSTGLSWEELGQPERIETTASPAIAAWCEGDGAAALLLSLESAPLIRWRVAYETGDESIHRLGSVTVGPSFGNDTIRVGPTMTAGVFVLGPGARVVWTPLARPSGVHIGVEGRATWQPLGIAAGDATLGLTAWLDPREGIRAP